MSKKKPLVPFSLTPTSWALRGEVRDVAEAHYYHEGEDLERRLAEIRLTGKDLQRELARIDLAYRHKDQFAYDMRMLEIEGKELDALEVLKVQHRHLKITEFEFDEAVANLRNPEGPSRKIAQIEVRRKHGRIDDYEADVQIARLQHADGALTRALLDIDHQHGRIDDFDYEIKVAELDFEDGTERELAVLEAKFRHSRIQSHDYEKEKATLKEEPWIAVIDSGFDPDQGINGVYFEFDWNEHWIMYLRLNGYSGPTDAAVVDAWFTDVCRAQGLAATNGNLAQIVPFGR